MNDPGEIDPGEIDRGGGDAGRRRRSTRALIGACIGLFLNPSPLVLTSFGVYVLPISRDTGWDRDVVASAVGVAMLLIALSTPVVGWLTNRYGPRRVSRIGFPLLGLAIMLLAAPTSAPMFVIALGVFGVLGAMQTAILYIYMISGWFSGRRGMALGLGMACTGLGIAVMGPLAAYLIGSLGWRATYLVLGTAVLLISIPVSLWLVLDPPAATASRRDDVPGIPWPQVLRTRVFWLLFGSIFLVALASSGGTVNLNLLLIERDVSPARASFVLTLLGISAIVARLVFGTLFDRVRAQSLTAMICLLVCTAFVVLATVGGVPSVILAAVLIGIGFGAEGDALSYMSSRAFGMRDFGTIFGVIFLAFTCGGASGPILFAVIRSQFGSFEPALWLAAGACLVAAGTVLLIRDEELPFAARKERGTATDDAVAPVKTDVSSHQAGSIETKESSWVG